MHLRLLLALCLTCVTLAYTTVDQVNSDIVTLDDSVKDLTASTIAYNGGLLSAINPGINFVPVEAELTKGVVDARSLPPDTLSVADTQRLVNTVSTTLAVDNPEAVKQLKLKKDLIEASGGSPIVKTGLQALLKEHLDFSASIIQRSPQSELEDVQSVVDIITMALQDGINTF